MKIPIFTFKSLAAKYLFVSAIFLLLIGSFISRDFFFTQYMKGDARRVNLAGRERMLTYKIASHMHFITASLASPNRPLHTKEVIKAMSEYGEVLYGLRDGEINLTLKPIHKHDEELVSQLNALIGVWENNQKPVLLDIIGKPADNAKGACQKCHSAFRANLPRIETFVKSLELHYEMELRKFDFYRLIFLCFLAVVSISMIVFVKKFLITPVKKLENAASKIERGDFGVSVDIKSSDEIGMLGSAFNSMSQTIKQLFDEGTKRVQELRESEKHLISIEKSLVNAQRIAHLGSWDWDIVKNRLYWSDEVYRIFRVEPQSFKPTYEAFLGFVHQDDREVVIKSVDSALSEKTTCSIDHRIVLPDGSERIVHEQAEVDFDETGRPVHMSGTVQDVTELKQMEEKLRDYSYGLEIMVKERTAELETANAELKKLFNAIEQAAESIVITDKSGIIQYVNPAFSAVSGYVKEEALGKNPILLNSGKNPPGLFKGMWKIILSGNIWKGTIINRKKTGELYYEEMTVAPVLNEQGNITNFIAIKNDVTDRIRSEEEIKQKNSELEEARLIAESANRAKSEFLANMSHELRTPLNAIMGFSEVLLNNMAGPVADNQKEFINDILESGKHLLSLINDILDLSKIEAGKMELDLSEVSINELIEGSLYMIREKAIQHRIHLQTDMQDDMGLVTADERKIKQVLFNLLGNAIKFTPDSGTITVRARRVMEGTVPDLRTERSGVVESGLSPDTIEISVEDTGIGISPEDQKRLFQPFQQLETTLLKKYAGTGLGLNLCKKFVELHGGEIRVESKEGKGSSFIFTIPDRQP